jgi:hypothetical protein
VDRHQLAPLRPDLRAALLTNKLQVSPVHLMNNNITPAFEAHGAKITTVLSDSGREFCGRPNQRPYELFLQPAALKTRAPHEPGQTPAVQRHYRTTTPHAPR